MEFFILADFTCLTYVGSAAIALFVGFLTGVFGVGGGFLMAPALMIFFGISGNIAVGTGLAVMFFNISFGMFKRRGTGTIDVKLALTTAGGSVFGVLIGIKILEKLKGAPALKIFGKEHVAVRYILLCMFLLLLAGVAGFLIFDLCRNSNKKLKKRIGLFAKIKIPPYVHFSSLESPKLSILPVVGFGCAVGILTGLLGVGGGVIMLPALIYLIGQRTAKAVGTSLLLVWISSAIAVTGHIALGNVKLMLLASMLVGGIIGTHFGTYIGLKLAGHKIRFYFVCIVIFAIALVTFELCKTTFG